MKRINHEEAYTLDGACTNWAEEFLVGCAELNKATITISPVPTCFAMHQAIKRPHGAKTIAASAMANRFT
jgi:hypothetical protein